MPNTRAMNITSISHSYLVHAGAAWLRRQGFAIVTTELATTATREIPDVIGFRASCSAVIEVKCSRSDFLRDRNKPHRQSGGLGVYRFFLSQPGIVEAYDLPPKWGLLHLDGRSIRRVLAPRGNLWAPYDSSGQGTSTWSAFQHETNLAQERHVLYSIARRLSIKPTATKKT